MAEVIARDGTWTFDRDMVRIVPGRERGTHKLRQVLGEVTVPLEAVSGVAYEPARKKGRLRLRLRDGADPLTQSARGRLEDTADPYQLVVESDRTGVAQYFVDEVRNALVVEQVSDGPSDRYLLPGPRVPLTAAVGDGTVSFDGERVRLEWNWMVEEPKKSAGPQQFTVSELASVEWAPVSGMDNGYLRFRLKGFTTELQPKHDPYCLTWGIRTLGGTAVLVAAAVVARLPHPLAPAPPPGLVKAAGPAGPDTDHDAMLRRLRELGDMHREGILTDEEFAAAKQALIRRL